MRGGEGMLRFNNGKKNSIFSCHCVHLALLLRADALEIRRRLGNAQINFDNLGGASAIKSKLCLHSACSKFGISLDLH